MNFMETLIAQKFEQWDKNIEDPYLSSLKNEKLNSIFNQLIKQSKYVERIPFSEIKESKINYSLECLLFGLEDKSDKMDKFQIFILNSQEILAKVYLDHINGGRVGLVHGGCLFFILILTINIFLKKILKIENYNLKHFKTQYKKKVPVNNLVLVKVVKVDGEQFRSQILEAELLDSDNEICTKITWEYQPSNSYIRKPKF
jgi:hypothetical protein